MDWCLWLYREFYWYKRAIMKHFCPREEKPYEKVTVHADSLPWLWLGNRRTEEDIITVTPIINNVVRYGDRVTPEYLSEISGFHGGVWYYIDVKTLEENVFPSEGFVIEDVFDQPVSDSE